MKPGARFWRSLRYAYEGIKYALTTQPNMKFHFFVSFVTLISAVFFKLSKLEILFILLAITLVIVAELINTAVESAVDLAMPERHPLAKIAKDVAAAAVLVTAVFAVAVGMIVFYEPVDRWLTQSMDNRTEVSPASIWLYLALVFLTVIVVETRFSRHRWLRPSLWTAVAFSLSTLLSLVVMQTLAVLLSYSLAFLFLIHLYRRRNRSLAALLIGAVTGTLITGLAYALNAV
ncbi:diacylglycerol kinase [Paenibacillus sp. CC-CFT747]|nr:diacylglycerol kinase [Paenibacillus sp. CC-CFT747]